MGYKHTETTAPTGTAERHGFGKQNLDMPTSDRSFGKQTTGTADNHGYTYGYTLPLAVDVVIYKGDRKGTYKYKTLGVQSKKTVSFCSTRFRSVSAARNHAKAYFNVLTSEYKS